MASQTLVSPIFWSYLVLRSDARAVLLHLLLALRSRRERSAILDMVKVVWLPPVRDSGPSVGVPRVDNTALILAREMAKIVHIHIGSDSHEPTSLLMLGFLAARLPPKVPLEGLTGLFLDWTNFEVAMVALRHLAPSLRRLCICTEEDALPSAARHKELGAVHFPALKSLDVRTFDCGNPELWLERLVAWSWTLPRLSKIAIGVHLNAWSPERRSGDFLVTFESACLIDLGVVSASFRSMADLGLKELAFDFGPNEEEDQVDFAKFVAGLDRAERGQVSTIRDIVLIETIDKPGDAADHCLVELVNRRRLPSLEKVVWVLAQPGNDAAVWSQ